MKNNLYRNASTGKIFVDRRSGDDRRVRRSIFPLSYIGPLRRKRGGRRDGDIGYVDIYDFRTLSLAVAVVLLSFMDAVLTHQHLVIGSAREANPVMQAVIRFGGIPAFYGAKGFLTLAAIVIIMLHKEWTLGRYAARFCLWAYITLSLYHLYLVSIMTGIIG